MALRLDTALASSLARPASPSRPHSAPPAQTSARDFGLSDRPVRRGSSVIAHRALDGPPLTRSASASSHAVSNDSDAEDDDEPGYLSLSPVTIDGKAPLMGHRGSLDAGRHAGSSLVSVQRRSKLAKRPRARCCSLTAVRHLLEDARHPRTGELRIPPTLRAYVPFLIWLVVSLSFTFTTAVWHDQVFGALSTWLKGAGALGYATLGLCILVTTVPPLPLYSTLIILSGYTFGAWRGFLISYTAALSGGVLVYLVCRWKFRARMVKSLASSPSLRQVVNAISKKPSLLFLIRLAPYPYNAFNCMLAASETLTFRTYFLCTAFALPKLIIHVSIGTTIRSFVKSRAASSSAAASPMDEEAVRLEAHGEHVRAVAGAIGIGLCVVVFGWIMVVARRAVRELDDGDPHAMGGYHSETSSPSTSAPPSPRFRALGLDSFAVDSTAGMGRTGARHVHERRPSLHGGIEEAEVGLAPDASPHVHPLTALERTRLELEAERIRGLR